MNRCFLLVVFCCIAWIVGLSQSSVNADNECAKTENLILKVVAAKVKFEESQYLKKGGQNKYKNIYANLVKEFKRKDKSLNYSSCLQKLLDDSGSINKKDVYFTYLPAVSSRIEPCNYLRYSAFLQTMLKNLNTPGNDSTVVCFQLN